LGFRGWGLGIEEIEEIDGIDGIDGLRAAFNFREYRSKPKFFLI